MFPIVFFPQTTVCGDKDEAVKFTENHCSFKAMMNVQQCGERHIYHFNAFDEVTDRIRRMKICAKSELTIIAELKNYIDCNNIKRQSYTVRMIDFVRTDDSFGKRPEPDAPAAENFPLPKEQQMLPEDGIDLDEFARNYQFMAKYLI